MAARLALFLALAAVAVVSAELPSDYIMVRLLFEGHDQYNFDKWHAAATAAAVAKAGGVPERYVLRMPDWRAPGQPMPKTVEDKKAAAAAPAPAQVATPVPIGAAATQPAPVPASAVTLITDGKQAAAAAPAAAGDVAARTDGASKPESSAATEIEQQQQQQQDAVLMEPQEPAPREQQLLQQLTQMVLGTPSAGGRGQRRGTRVMVLGGRRHLLITANQAEAYFAIKTNPDEPSAVRDVVKRKLLASAAGFGMASGTSQKGFYALLKENGVTYYPAMWVDGSQILAGQVGLEAPFNRFINHTGAVKSFQHKLFDPRDLADPATRANATAVTVAEPAFVMANRSTAPPAEHEPVYAPKGQQGLPGWAVALIVLGVIAAAIAMGASVWRCVRERQAQHADEGAEGPEEPLSPQSHQSHSHERA